VRRVQHDPATSYDGKRWPYSVPAVAQILRDASAEASVFGKPFAHATASCWHPAPIDWDWAVQVVAAQAG
jgi:hypothetical protein